ncbi:MarR family transcriptional regulator [Gordonia phthalatica]|uniref:MarR family transcriptional regulator n=1 Tax=Gordonia phthalatica TaxID=1136941 RepID=A0A0N9N4R3_9ACTN|nr:MarR family transcriptional regulator [Gordonia phthalatica]ALG85422.1 MarR family transcriptional regulator [Gordonia phthalatica]
MAGVDHESSEHETGEHDPIALARRNWEDAGWGDDVADGMEAVTSVMRAHQIMLARVEQELKPFGLTFSRFELLRLLAFSRHGSLPISKASDRLQVHVSSATHAIARLADAGLVERLPHPTDGRTTLVSITPDGRELVEKATVVLNSGVFAQVGMSRSSARQLVSAIRELRSANGDF